MSRKKYAYFAGCKSHISIWCGIVLIFVAIQAVASDIFDPSLVVALLFKACMFLL